MEQLVNKIINIDYDELTTFCFPMDEKFGLSVMLNNVKYEFLIQFKYNNDKIVCLGSGNKADDDPHDNSRPYFHRNSWSFDASTIWYNDPTRYLSQELPGAWGVGKEDNYYLRNIGKIIVKLANRIKLNEKNLLFYGSSMGGFTSIQLATMFKGSTALADIPQLFFQNHIRFDQVCKYAFPNMSKEEIMKKYRYRFDVLNMMVKEEYIPNAIIVLDCSERDINTQYIDFIKGINQLPDIKDKTNSIKIVLNNINSHNPINKKESQQLVNEISSKNLMCYINELNSSEMYKENIQLKKDKQELTDVLIEWGDSSYNKIDLEKQINKEIGEKNKFKKELDDKIKTINELNNQLEEKQNEINSLLSSKSWKITKPLRKIVNLFKRKN